ncbi:MAG: crosslink repair DNA glycosylase YcaQ family protein [Hellea sp.]
MGFVQLDTIRTVSRAHHHILWSRNQNYREPMLWNALKDRHVFEHFTHDASILPIELYPVWQWQRERMQARYAARKNWKIDAPLLRDIKARITAEGALSTHAFDTKITGKKDMWDRPPHKRALDYLWYTGELSTCRRENFTKFYDLSERVIPSDHYGAKPPEDKLGWLCKAALKRLIIANAAELQDFWGAASAAQIKGWISNGANDVQPVEIETATGQWLPGFAVANIEAQLEGLKSPTSRLRILNPFDPLVRNRKRLLRLFGFDYKIEIFVPAAKRRWGYYVYPILQGDRFIGRIEVKADRKAGTLTVLKLWKEQEGKWSERQDVKLEAEVKRLARFIGVETIIK